MGSLNEQQDQEWIKFVQTINHKCLIYFSSILKMKKFFNLMFSKREKDKKLALFFFLKPSK